MRPTSLGLTRDCIVPGSVAGREQKSYSSLVEVVPLYDAVGLLWRGPLDQEGRRGEGDHRGRSHILRDPLDRHCHNLNTAARGERVKDQFDVLLERGIIDPRKCVSLPRLLRRNDEW